MTWKMYFKKGISLRLQTKGMPPAGPISPSLRAMATLDSDGLPVSPVGADVAQLANSRKVWVFFVHTAGAGATPWRGQIVLDMDFRGEGQVASQSNIGLVAHELTHVFQRDLPGSHYWPSGGLRLAGASRMVGDSTNYMEVLAYLVGWTVEHDLLAQEISTAGLTPQAIEHRRRRADTLVDRLATLADENALNAIRYILTVYPQMPVYQQNYRTEVNSPDRRIPEGGWQHWLGRMSFSAQAISHIQTLAAGGQVTQVSKAEADHIAGL